MDDYAKLYGHQNNLSSLLNELYWAKDNLLPGPGRAKYLKDLFNLVENRLQDMLQLSI